MDSIYTILVKDSAGKEQELSVYKSKVLLIVNVASRCGFTPQYKALEELYKKYAERGLVVLGFPCNQFGGQEPGSDAEIQSFCELNFGVTFPVMAKLEVNGNNTHELYRFLKSHAPGVLGTQAIKWNFTKFLVNREGQVVERYAPATDPSEIAGAIELLLGSRNKITETV